MKRIIIISFFIVFTTSSLAQIFQIDPDCGSGAFQNYSASFTSPRCQCSPKIYFNSLPALECINCESQDVTMYSIFNQFEGYGFYPPEFVNPGDQLSLELHDLNSSDVYFIDINFEFHYYENVSVNTEITSMFERDSLIVCNTFSEIGAIPLNYELIDAAGKATLSYDLYNPNCSHFEFLVNNQKIDSVFTFADASYYSKSEIRSLEDNDELLFKVTGDQLCASSTTCLIEPISSDTFTSQPIVIRRVQNEQTASIHSENLIRICEGDTISLSGTANSPFFRWYDKNYSYQVGIGRAASDSLIVTRAGLYLLANSTTYTGVGSIDKCPEVSNVVEVQLVDDCFVTGESDNQNIEESFSMYPNPVGDKLFISHLHDSKVEIYSIDGNLIFSSGLTQLYFINVQNWDPGEYIYKITSKERVRRGRFTKI